MLQKKYNWKIKQRNKIFDYSENILTISNHGFQNLIIYSVTIGKIRQ